MSSVVNSLCNVLGISALWGAVAPLARLFGIAVLFALGTYLLIRTAHTIQVIRESPDMYEKYVAYKCRRYNKKHGIY